MQRVIVHCKYVSGCLCAPHKKRSGGRGPEVSSHVSCVWLHLVLQILWVEWSEPSLTQVKSLWEEKLKKNFSGFEIQVCHSGMVQPRVKPPAKHLHHWGPLQEIHALSWICIMSSFLMSTEAISQSFVFPSISQLTGFHIQPKIHEELNFREIWATEHKKFWMNLKLGWIWRYDTGIGSNQCIWLGVGQTHYEADRKMTVFLTHTRGHQAARTQIQGGWCKSWTPSHVPSKVQKNLRVPSLASGLKSFCTWDLFGWLYTNVCIVLFGWTWTKTRTSKSSSSSGRWEHPAMCSCLALATIKC